MNLILESISHPKLAWDNYVPSGFRGKRLPGSRVSSASGEFGSICLQEYRHEFFSFYYHVFDLAQQFIFKTRLDVGGIDSVYVFTGNYDIETSGLHTRKVTSNQFCLFNTPLTQTVTLSKKLHIGFSAFFSDVLTVDYSALLKKPLSAGYEPRWADNEVINSVNSILEYPYDEEFLRLHFEQKVRDLLFSYLAQSQQPYAQETISSKELAAVQLAEQIITKDLSDHVYIPDLARMVLLNEFRLKKLFKQVFGKGPYEYLTWKRMERARYLLELGLSVKQVASEVGYRPSDLAVAFRQHFGFTPSSVKKKQ